MGLLVLLLLACGVVMVSLVRQEIDGEDTLPPPDLLG
jgi:hypothetical protein